MGLATPGGNVYRWQDPSMFGMRGFNYVLVPSAFASGPLSALEADTLERADMEPNAAGD